MDVIRLDGYLYIPDFNTIINTETEDIFLKNIHNRDKVKIYDLSIDKETIKREFKKIKQITFETTQDCNLSCKYCVYSNSYKNTRNITKKKLEFKTAKKALDLIFSLIKYRKKKRIAIGFYGGEPMLNFDNVRRIVEYAQISFTDFEIIFSMTTNGTLLKKEDIDFLKKHNFRLLVSLDGPEDVHNAKRVYRSGEGTFEKIIKNLKKVKRTYPNYYERYISFSVVWSRDLLFEKIYNFFINNELVNNSGIRLSPVSESDTDYYQDYHYDVTRAKLETDKIFKVIINKIENQDKLAPIDYSILRDPLNYLIPRKSFTSLFGACFLNAKVYVDVDGRFHICHLVNDKFSYGNIDEGLNLKKMQNILENYIALNKKFCLECNLRFLCERCYVQFAKAGRLEIDRRFCQAVQKTIVPRLKRYIQMKRKGFI